MKIDKKRLGEQANKISAICLRDLLIFLETKPDDEDVDNKHNFILEINELATNADFLIDGIDKKDIFQIYHELETNKVHKDSYTVGSIDTLERQVDVIAHICLMSITSLIIVKKGGMKAINNLNELISKIMSKSIHEKRDLKINKNMSLEEVSIKLGIDSHEWYKDIKLDVNVSDVFNATTKEKLHDLMKHLHSKKK